MRAAHALTFLLLFASWPHALAHIAEYTDWAIACDNTRRCQASGFQADHSPSDPVMLVLTREAGPRQPLQAALSVQGRDDADVGLLSITAGKVTLKEYASGQDLEDDDLDRLLPHLLKESTASVTDGKSSWSLSLTGLKAALLKMDEVQGRVDTPGALVRKGGKPETSVLPPVPAPVLRGAPLAKTRKTDTRLLAPIIKAIGKGACAAAEDDADRESEEEIHRLSDSQVLVSRRCTSGPYQSGYSFWIANATAPHAPKLLAFPTEHQRSDSILMNAGFEDGVISELVKGRATLDCGSSRRWLWTAHGFQLLEAHWAPLCRGIVGGVSMRNWIARRAGAPE